MIKTTCNRAQSLEKFAALVLALIAVVVPLIFRVAHPFQIAVGGPAAGLERRMAVNRARAGRRRPARAKGGSRHRAQGLLEFVLILALIVLACAAVVLAVGFLQGHFGPALVRPAGA